MVCRETLKEDCLVPIYGMFDFLWLPELSTCSPKSEINPVGVGRGRKISGKTEAVLALKYVETEVHP